MTTPDLIPCPFCGGKPVWVSLEGGFGQVTCAGCPAGTCEGDIRRLRAAWNTRAPLAEAHDEQLSVWADELMSDLILDGMIELVDHEYDTKVQAQRTIIEALKKANEAKVPLAEALAVPKLTSLTGHLTTAAIDFVHTMEGYGFTTAASQSGEPTLDFAIGIYRDGKSHGSASFDEDGTWSGYLEIGSTTFRCSSTPWFNLPEGLAEALRAIGEPRNG